MSKTSRTPYKKRIAKKRDVRAMWKEKKETSVATANSLDNCEQTVLS